MTIIRGPRKQRDFTILDNAALYDERLSFRARGILAYLLSKPPEWRTNARQLAAATTGEGRDAIRTALNELEAVGYLVRQQTRNERGQWVTLTEVREDCGTSDGTGAWKTGPGDSATNDTGAWKTGPGKTGSGKSGPLVRTEHKELKQGSPKATPLLVDPPAPAPLEDDSAARCSRHRLEASPPPCHACAARRRTAEAAAAQERARQLDADVAARAEAIEQCDLCDGEGYRGHRLCGHDPEQDERNRRGYEATMAALGKATETGAGCTINAPHHHN